MTPEENHMLARIHASISDLMDGGVTAAAIGTEAEGGCVGPEETAAYWRECAEGLHLTVVNLQDERERLVARAENAEVEAAARALAERDDHTWAAMGDSFRGEFREYARAALTAAKEARA